MSLIERDKEQRRLALDASQSFIVQAPAGSGKTELLIQRFLALLNHTKTPEEILAITFTKKAANEMRLRVIKALKQADSDSEPQSEHAKKTWKLAKKVLERDKKLNWNLIDNPNQLRIQTIDSLCAYLTKQLPLLSHFGSQPDIADNPYTLYREAVHEILMHVEEHYAWSNAISRLLLHMDNDLNKLHDLLINLLAKRDQWLPYIQFEDDNTEIKKQLEKNLTLIISDSLSALKAIFPQELVSELTAIARFAANNVSLSYPESEISSCLGLTELPGLQACNKPIWLALAKLLLTKNFSWRKRLDADIGFPPLSNLKNPQEKMQHTSYRQRLNTLITTLAEREDLRLAFSELFFLPEPHYPAEQWEILQALLQVLKIVTAQLRLTFQQHGQIDFIENTQAALAALGNDENPTDLALALDYQIKHILVDEFQDTSFTQYQLLEKLIMGWEENDGRTLFIVGDPMQSIYRFREAEVGIFIRIRHRGIANIKLTPLTLAMNFRSTQDIVDWNNKHFKKIFPSFNDMATGAVSFSPSISHQATDFKKDTSIEIRGFLDANDQIQADSIVAILKEKRKNDPYEKIAILVRSRSHLSAIIPSLKKAKLPYSAIDIEPLASRQIIQDLFSLTCALLHPADRISWLSILRAPWCGLTLADLLVIAGGTPNTILCEQLECNDVIQRLSPDGQQRLLKTYSILKNKMLERARCSLRYWIESTWLLLGGPACLNEFSDINDANEFFKLLEEFGNSNQVLNLENLKEKINKLFAVTQYDESVIQIMTIHSAKGLEFDTVILPHLERKLPNDDKSLLSWLEQPLANDKVALLLAPIHATGNEKDSIYEYIHHQKKIKSDYETDRLFYVATTRAKKSLHIFFNMTKNENGDFRIDSGSFLEKIWPHLKKHQEQIITPAPLTPLLNEKNSKYFKRLNSNWINPLQNMSITPVYSHQKQNGFLLNEIKFKLIGTVTHRVLQQLSLLGFHWWLEKNTLQRATYLEYQFKQLSMLAHDIKDAVNICLQAIQNSLNDKRGTWILQAHQDARSELAISAIINGENENLIIDRTFIDENGVRWIIDYKTTAFTRHDLEEFLAKEQKKYLEKMHKYFQAVKLIDDRPIRLGLYFPVLPAWQEWDPRDLDL